MRKIRLVITEMAPEQVLAEMRENGQTLPPGATAAGCRLTVETEGFTDVHFANEKPSAASAGLIRTFMDHTSATGAPEEVRLRMLAAAIYRQLQRDEQLDQQKAEEAIKAQG